MKKYIRIRSNDIDDFMEYKDSINLKEFLDNINEYKNECEKLNSKHELEFFIEVHWSGEGTNIQLSCQRLETDLEYEHRINIDKKLKKQIKLKNLIKEMNELSGDDYHYVLEVLNRK